MSSYLLQHVTLLSLCRCGNTHALVELVPDAVNDSLESHVKDKGRGEDGGHVDRVSLHENVVECGSPGLS